MRRGENLSIEHRKEGKTNLDMAITSTEMVLSLV